MKRILIVDDETDITTPLRIGLERQGYEVQTCNYPIDAISNFKPGFFDILILDIRMPKMSGFDLYRELRKKEKRGYFFFLTAYDISHEEFKRMLPEADANQLLRKPIGISDLVAKVELFDKNQQKSE